MSTIWFIADLHLGHGKVAALRGFEDVNHHDVEVIEKWEKQVTDRDAVYVLGDLSSGSYTAEARALEILKNLPGRKRLIAGNHDSISGLHRKVSPNKELFNQVFEKISDFGRVRIADRQVLLSHFPYTKDHKENPRYAEFRLPDIGMLLIHGHTHQEFHTAYRGREFCVSWEARERLVSLKVLESWVRSFD